MTPDGWQRVSIDAIKAKSPNAIAIGPFGSRMKSDRYVSVGIPVIRGNNISDTRELTGDFVYVTPETADELKTSNVFPDDLIFPHRGAIGQVGIVPRGRKERYILSTSLMKLTINTKLADPRFIFYFFRSPEGRHELLMRASTVGTPGIGQPLASLRSIAISLPTLSEQRTTADILGCLDDKIELNRRMNETLEAMARALFKSWFVDFDPVRAKSEGRETGMPESIADLFPDSFEDSELGEIPKGWSAVAVYEIAAYINGAAYMDFQPNDEKRGLPIIKIAELKAGVTAQTKFSDVQMPEKYRITEGDILFSWSGNPDTSIDTFVWSRSPGWLNQHIFRVLPLHQHERAFVLLALKVLRPVFAEIARNKQTTGLGHVTAEDMKRLIISRPDDRVMHAWNTVAAPLHRRAFQNDLEAHSLSALRDTLLPKLISGEVRVGKAERLIEAAQ